MKNKKKTEKLEISITEIPVLLKSIRQIKGLTMQQFADQTGLKSRQETYQLESGRTPIGLNRFVSITEKLGIETPTIIVKL